MLNIHTEYTQFCTIFTLIISLLPWSDSYARRVLSGLALAIYFCSSMQVAQVFAEEQFDYWLLALDFYHNNLHGKVSSDNSYAWIDTSTA